MKYCKEDYTQVRIGTLGIDADFDKLCAQSGIDNQKLDTQWEAYVIKTVRGVKNNILIVAGSSPRGTAYGIMEEGRMEL